MELVYLWVEDYKNIQKQGFNFSPKFNCHYDGKTLTIKDNIDEDDNKQYIENFFGDNINVTAIVGKNGSGKSSILKAFGYTWNNIYYIFYQNGQLYSNHFEENTSKYSIQKKDIDTNDIIYLNKMFFMELDKGGFFNSLSLEKENVYTKLFQDKLTKKDNRLDRDIFHKNILQIILNGSLNLSYFKPTEIVISFNDFHRELNQSNDYNNIYSNYRTELMKIIGKKDKTDEDKRNEKILKKRLSAKAQYKIYLKSLEIINDKIEKDKIIDFCQQDIEEILNFHCTNCEDDYIFLDDKGIDTFLNRFTVDNINMLTSKKYLLKDFKKEFFTKENEDEIEIFFYLYRIGFLKYDFYDDIGNRFSNLSSGEKSLFVDFNLIRKYINEYIKENNDFKKNNLEYKENIELLIFLDEPDLTLHPEWQRQYISHIISLLKEYKDINFHLVFTTHSPFLLSDIPKQNTIFLDTYDDKSKEKYPNLKFDNFKDGDCINVSQVIDIKPFGANIHNLLAHGFFMDEGLIGEFAKNKIMQIKKFHKKVLKYKENEKVKQKYKCFYKKKQKEFEQIQSIIGEPFLKTVIKNYLDEIENILFDDAKVKEMAIKRLVKEFDKDDIMRVLNDKV